MRASDSRVPQRLRVYVALFMLFGWYLPARLWAQCTGVCGDVNGTSTVTTADIIALARYTERAADTFLFQPECADVDDHEGLTMRDLCALTDFVFLGPPLDCQTDQGAYAPLPNTEAYLHFNSVIPPGDSLIRLYIDGTIPGQAMGLAFVVRVLVDGQQVQFGDIRPEVSEGYGWNSTEFGDERTAVVPPGHLMGGYANYQFPDIVPGRHPLGEACVMVSPSASYRTLTMELLEWPPGDNTPMLVKDVPFDALELNLAPWVVDITGDANHDRVRNAADIILLVNFVFKGGPTPFPVPAAGDVNCSGDVTSADVIVLVNHVFKGGTPPCDVEAMCTINFDQWACP